MMFFLLLVVIASDEEVAEAGVKPHSMGASVSQEVPSISPVLVAVCVQGNMGHERIFNVLLPLFRNWRHTEDVSAVWDPWGFPNSP